MYSKSNPRYLWHLWKCWHFWQLRTSTHYNHTDLTIKSDTGQDSQFLIFDIILFEKITVFMKPELLCVVAGNIIHQIKVQNFNKFIAYESYFHICCRGLAGGKVVSLLITFLGKVFHPATFFLFISSTHLQNFTGNTLKLRTHSTTQIFCHVCSNKWKIFGTCTDITIDRFQLNMSNILQCNNVVTLFCLIISPILAPTADLHVTMHWHFLFAIIFISVGSKFPGQVPINGVWYWYFFWKLKHSKSAFHCHLEQRDKN